MEQFFVALFGVQGHLTVAQEAARAVLIFAYGLLLLRLSGPRMFGQWSALDIVISIIVGSALGRAMTGSAPLLGTMVAAAVMALLHVGLAHCVARDEIVARVLEGRAVIMAGSIIRHASETRFRSRICGRPCAKKGSMARRVQITSRT